VTDEDLPAWEVRLVNSPDYFNFTWNLEHGAVVTQSNYCTRDVTPGPDAVILLWWARYNAQIGSGTNFSSLIAALTYAQTGRTL
jgi:hypothetical protein